MISDGREGFGERHVHDLGWQYGSLPCRLLGFWADVLSCLCSEHACALSMHTFRQTTS